MLPVQLAKKTCALSIGAFECLHIADLRPNDTWFVVHGAAAQQIKLAQQQQQQGALRAAGAPAAGPHGLAGSGRRRLMAQATTTVQVSVQPTAGQVRAC
jgi:hypothetical protein